LQDNQLGGNVAGAERNFVVFSQKRMDLLGTTRFLKLATDEHGQ
jgi:hypothetical protein